VPRFDLVAHPDHPTRAVTAVRATAERSIDWLHLHFEVDAGPGAIRWPAPVTPAFRDGLWQHTCFEAFCSIEGKQGYREVNLSPSGEWAVYDFSAYRKSMSRAARTPVRYFRAKERSVSAVVDIGRGDWNVGLAVIIEEEAGGRSYWALSHGPKKPDFHNPACFTAALPSPRPA
jgi:hypothetical protein